MWCRYAGPHGATSRGVVLVGACILAGLLTHSALVDQRWWERVGVPTLTPSFADARVITSGWECHRRGLDVMRYNPCDPIGGRVVNQPPVWLGMSALGLGQAQTVAIAFLWGALAIAGMLWLARPQNLVESGVWTAFLLSPPVLLALERGNADLLIFTLVLAGSVLLRDAPVWKRAGGWSMLIMATVLKLYPVFALVVLFRQGRRVSLVMTAAAGAVLLAYTIALFPFIDDIERGTQRGLAPAYGFSILHDAAQNARGSLALAPFRHLPAEVLLLVGAGAAAVAACAAVRGRFRAMEAPLPQDVHGDLFLAGASIFVGSFCLGANWDYRLIFLGLTLPHLLRVARAGRGALLARGLVAALLTALWLSSRSETVEFFDEALLWLVWGYFLTMLLIDLAHAREPPL